MSKCTLISDKAWRDFTKREIGGHVVVIYHINILGDGCGDGKGYGFGHIRINALHSMFASDDVGKSISMMNPAFVTDIKPSAPLFNVIELNISNIHK